MIPYQRSEGRVHVLPEGGYETHLGVGLLCAGKVLDLGVHGVTLCVLEDEVKLSSLVVQLNVDLSPDLFSECCADHRKPPLDHVCHCVPDVQIVGISIAVHCVKLLAVLVPSQYHVS